MARVSGHDGISMTSAGLALAVGDNSVFAAMRKACDASRTVFILGRYPNLEVRCRLPFARRLSRVIELCISHFDIGRQIRLAHPRPCLISGFTTGYWPFIRLGMGFSGGHAYFVVHHNFQSALRNRLQRRILRDMQKKQSHFILFETDAAVDALGLRAYGTARFVVIPLPVDRPLVARFRPPDRPKTIGIVGRYRKEKMQEDLVSQVLALKSKPDVDFDILVGMDRLPARISHLRDQIMFVDTTSRDAYVNTLTQCDILLLKYEKSKYFYRASGTIADGIAHGCYIVCPDFPVMRCQITSPRSVGHVYTNTAEIPLVLRHALSDTARVADSDYEAHFQGRSVQILADIFARELQDT